jgi:hypothetical protein
VDRDRERRRYGFLCFSSATPLVQPVSCGPWGIGVVADHSRSPAGGSSALFFVVSVSFRDGEAVAKIPKSK